MTSSFWSLSLLLNWGNRLALSASRVSRSCLSSGLTLSRRCLVTFLRFDLLLSILLVLVDGPIEDVIVLETLTDEEITEDLAEVRVIRLVIESEGTCVVEIDGKFVGEAAAEDFRWGCHLLLHDSVVLLLLGSSLQTLPWERTTTEVKHDVSKGFHIITTGLLWENMISLMDDGTSEKKGTYRHQDGC